MRLPLLDNLEAAANVVYAAMSPTPQYRWPLLCERLGADVWVKHENHAPTGAFKVRGGLVYFDALTHRGKVAGVVAATRGNHGQSVGFAAARYGIPAAIVVPQGNAREKNHAMRALGVELIVAGDDFQASVEYSIDLARERGWHRVPPFDPHLVAGVGTYAVELLRAVPTLETVYVPIGMGSGICGMIAARDALQLKTRIVGVVSAGAPAYALSFAARHVIEHDVTTQLADGLACRRPDAAALDMIVRGVDRVVTVTDDEVADAMRALYSDTHNVAEGAGAAPLAALMQEQERQRGRPVGIILCGGNVDGPLLGRILLENHAGVSA